MNYTSTWQENYYFFLQICIHILYKYLFFLSVDLRWHADILVRPDRRDPDTPRPAWPEAGSTAQAPLLPLEMLLAEKRKTVLPTSWSSSPFVARGWKHCSGATAALGDGSSRKEKTVLPTSQQMCVCFFFLGCYIFPRIGRLKGHTFGTFG
jgi:hypothetical protein